MRVFLTGSTGYIGNRIAYSLANSGNKVHALIRDPKSKNLPNHPNIRFFKGDLLDRSALDSAMKNCKKVVHSAAYTNLRCRSLDPFYKTNVIGTENVCQAALQFGVEHLVYTSSLSVFGPALYQVPIVESQPRLESYANDYELTKTMSEELVREYGSKGLPFTILNLSRVYGPGPISFSNGVNTLINKFIKNRLLFVPDKLHKEANYVFIDDVIQAHEKALQNKPLNQNFIIGGENCSYYQLFDSIRSITRSDISVVKVKYELVKQVLALTSFLGRMFSPDHMINPAVIDSLFTNRSASSEKAEKILNYHRTPLDQGLLHTVEHLK